MISISPSRGCASALALLLLTAGCTSTRELMRDVSRKMGRTPAIEAPKSDPELKPAVRLVLQSVQGTIRFPFGVTSVYAAGHNRMRPHPTRARKAIESALLLLPEDRKIVIVGHSDPVGGPYSAFYHGAARAHSVRNYLVARGLPRDRLVAMTAGASDLRNKDDVRALENHRITFSVK